jgi:cyclohexa-1,5-dienecarbonyl-CoA hydratase
MNPYEYIRIERNEAHATLWLDHPPLNVLTIMMMEEMIRAIEQLASEEQIRLLVLRGKGGCFSAGMDVTDHLPDRVHIMMEKMHVLMMTILGLDILTVSAIHGSALGGGLELAAITDFAYADVSSKMGLPEIKLGVFPPLAVALFPELIGHRNAQDLILSGRTIDAQEALRMGLVSAVFESEQFEMRIQQAIDHQLLKSKSSIAITKKCLRDSLSSQFERLAQAEKIYLQGLMKTDDSLEGLNAFLEKREPKWKHR